MVAPRPPLVVVESAAARDASEAEVEGAGWTVVRTQRPAAGQVWSLRVEEPPAAEAAVLAAIRGCGLVVLAPRGLATDLAVDLRSLGTVHYRDETTAALDVSAWAMLHAVARGHTVETTARMLHLSVRTAQRRIAAAQRELGAGSLAAAVARLTDADRIPPAP